MLRVAVILGLLTLSGCKLGVELARWGYDEATAYRGPIETVPMVPWPGAGSEQADETACRKEARYAYASHYGRMLPTFTLGREIFGPYPEAATNFYVWCMAEAGYQCAARSENPFCQEAWNHATASRAQFLRDRQVCVKESLSLWFPFGYRIHNRRIECMAARGYQKG